MNALVDRFMEVMAGQPLSLALCVMNLLLLWYCFRITGQYSKARSEALNVVASWQKEAQELMAGSVSQDSLKIILEALERDRETYRAMLPTFHPPPSDP